VYFMVSWDIHADNPVWGQINERMQNCFAKYKSVCPLYTFYFVKVSNQGEYETILSALQEIAKSSQNPVYFAMSPLLTITGWGGWLNDPYWDQMRQIMS